MARAPAIAFSTPDLTSHGEGGQDHQEGLGH